MADESFPCCEHCGPPTANPTPDAIYGSGDGHAKPCPSCQRYSPVPSTPEEGKS